MLHLIISPLIIIAQANQAALVPGAFSLSLWPYAFHNLAHHSEIFPIIPEFDGTISMFDIHKIPHIIHRGREATLEQLPHIKRLLGA